MNETLENQTPLTDIVDKGKHLELFVELPGVSKDNLEVELKKNQLNISGRQVAKKGKDSSEIKKFSRAFTLNPELFNPEQISAHLENGLLKLKLVKTEENQPRKIQIH